MEREARAFYDLAVGRMSGEECERETRRGGPIPYPLSLHALAPYVFETGTRQGWLPPGEKPLLMAVSGGGDSVAMLWLFRAFYGGPLLVAHVNHRLRGRDSDGDATFVKGLAGRWGLPFVERKVFVLDEQRAGESVEMAARRVRHRELASLADANGAWGVAMGHTRDDLAETVLFNLLRGAGFRGSVGIPERRGPFFRPLLGLRRTFLRDILRVRGIEWREDATNGDTAATRNFLRLELLPLVEERVNAGAIEHLAAFAGEMRQRRENEEWQGRALLEATLADGDGGGLNLKREVVASFSPLERALVIREAGRRMGLSTLSRRRVETLSRLIARHGPFVFQWARGADVLGESGMIRWVLKNS